MHIVFILIFAANFIICIYNTANAAVGWEWGNAPVSESEKSLSPFIEAGT